MTLAELPFKRISGTTALGYIVAQIIGGIGGAILANLMFKVPAIKLSTHTRSGANIFLGEVVATAGLLLIIHLIGYQKRGHLAPVLVAGWIGSAYFFTSSTSFANPAVTIARGFSNTFAGIALHSVPLFVLAQIIGAGLGISIAALLNQGATHE